MNNVKKGDKHYLDLSLNIPSEIVVLYFNNLNICTDKIKKHTKNLTRNAMSFRNSFLSMVEEIFARDAILFVQRNKIIFNKNFIS